MHARLPSKNKQDASVGTAHATYFGERERSVDRLLDDDEQAMAAKCAIGAYFGASDDERFPPQPFDPGAKALMAVNHSDVWRRGERRVNGAIRQRERTRIAETDSDVALREGELDNRCREYARSHPSAPSKRVTKASSNVRPREASVPLDALRTSGWARPDVRSNTDGRTRRSSASAIGSNVRRSSAHPRARAWVSANPYAACPNRAASPSTAPTPLHGSRAVAPAGASARSSISTTWGDHCPRHLPRAAPRSGVKIERRRRQRRAEVTHPFGDRGMAHGQFVHGFVAFAHGTIMRCGARHRTLHPHPNLERTRQLEP